MPASTPAVSKDAELADQLAAALVLLLRRPTVTDEDRMHILEVLTDRICDHCGRLEEDNRPCRCWDDS